MAWLSGLVPQEGLRKGANQVTVRLPKAVAPLRLTGVEVRVQYSGTK